MLSLTFVVCSPGFETMSAVEQKQTTVACKIEPLPSYWIFEDSTVTLLQVGRLFWWRHVKVNEMSVV